MLNGKGVLDVKPIAVRYIGRAHLACLRCRSQKSKCSGDKPVCQNCLASNKECIYPQRDKKVTLLESQFNELKNRIKFLEKKLEEQNLLIDRQESIEKELKSISDEDEDVLVNEIKAVDMNSTDPSVASTNKIEIKKSSSYNDRKVIDNEAIDHSDDEAIIPFHSKSSGNTSVYFGSSSGQVFDSELKSHLFEITQNNDKSLSPYSSPLCQRRHFFKDPTLDSSFSGIVMLPDKAYALQLVDKVIKFLSHEYYLFNAKDFYKQIDEAYEKLKDKKPLWICYFLITLAVGEQYINHSPDDKIPGMGFYIAAMRLYKSSYEEPTLEFVQTLLLIAFYLQGLNSANAAFSFYGLAMRSALIQGLHRNMPFLSDIEREKRKRLWWTVFIMDNIWCSNLGHPTHVQIEDVDVEFPNENIVSLNDNFNIELMGYNVQLATILGSVMKDVYSPNNGSTSIKVKKVLECVEQFDELQNILPSRIKNNLLIADDRSTANLYLRLNQYIIVTTRPLLLSLFKGYVQPTDSIKKVVSRCVNASISSIDILNNLKNNDWLSAFGFWDAQFCFSALIILTICSFAGNVYSQTSRGRLINKYMKDAGNFTALDNEHRLIELDELLSKIPTYAADFQNTESYANQMNKNNNDTHNHMEHENENYHASLEEDQQQHLPYSNIPTQLNYENYNTTDGNINVINNATTNKNSDSEGASLYQNNYDSKQQSNDHKTETHTAINTDTFTNFLNDLETTYAGTIGDFTSFRNNVSPDTWNELTNNLQFWDPSKN